MGKENDEGERVWESGWGSRGKKLSVGEI